MGQGRADRDTLDVHHTQLVVTPFQIQREGRRGKGRKSGGRCGEDNTSEVAPPAVVLRMILNSPKGVVYP